MVKEKIFTITRRSKLISNEKDRNQIFNKKFGGNLLGIAASLCEVFSTTVLKLRCGHRAVGSQWCVELAITASLEVCAELRNLP